MLTLDTRVIVIAPWSTFRGRTGRVVQLEPYLAVLLDGESKPLRMGDREVIPADESRRHVAGAE